MNILAQVLALMFMLATLMPDTDRPDRHGRDEPGKPITEEWGGIR
jgi:hypothetical protein